MNTKVKKITVARNIFNSHIALALAGEGRAFRAAVRDEIMETLGVSECSSGALYNTLKKEAEKAGTFSKGHIGRTGVAARKPAAAAKPAAPVEVLDWAIVKDGTVNYAKSRSAARLLATSLGNGWVVKKSTDLAASAAG